jgi:restriction endonuclease Mrr
MPEIKESSLKITENVENLTPKSLIFFAYDFENNEELAQEILEKTVEKISDNLNKIF